MGTASFGEMMGEAAAESAAAQISGKTPNRFISAAF
jgi:hypothetical protein